MSDTFDRAKRIRLAIFDVDGVLTDGSLYFTDSGEEIKAFNARDGHGLKMLQETGVRLAIITSRTSRSVEARARNLGIELLFQGVADKLAAFEELLAQLGLEAGVAFYMGDDVIDLPVMRRCGFAATVTDAPPVVKTHAHYVSRSRGGQGAVREVCELIMHAQDTLDARIAPYLE
jgi:3-deoxy-D-manno-octulosonate 8-phosphate phosphatase (KDO 8-P phosphatase)